MAEEGEHVRQHGSGHRYWEWMGAENCSDLLNKLIPHPFSKQSKELLPAGWQRVSQLVASIWAKRVQ